MAGPAERLAVGGLALLAAEQRLAGEAGNGQIAASGFWSCKGLLFLRRPILKPRKIVVQGAPSARRCAISPFGLSLDHESCRGFTGAYQRDGRIPGRCSEAASYLDRFVHGAGGVIAMKMGPDPTLIALSAVLVAVRIGVTVSPL